jgi:dihydrofolate reductase
MRKLVYYVGVSIDGYIAGPGNEIEFYPLGEDMVGWMAQDYPDVLPTHVRAQFGIADAPNRHFDTLVMGRGTYQPGLDLGIANPYAHLRSYVVSTTLAPIADDGIEVYGGDPVELVRKLKAEDGLDIYLAGGGKLAAAVLDEVDALIIKNYPVVAGDGTPAFTGNFSPTVFTPTDRKAFENGAYVTWYDRA